MEADDCRSTAGSIFRACCRGELSAPERAGGVAARRRLASGKPVQVDHLPSGSRCHSRRARGARLAGGRRMHLLTTALWPPADVRAMAHEPASPGAGTRTGHHPRARSASPAKARQDPLEPSRACILVLGAGTGTCQLFFIGFGGRGAAPRGRHLIASVPSRAAAEPPGDHVSSRLPAGRRHRPALRGRRELPQGRRPAGHRVGEQALAQRTGPIAMAGQCPVPR
jgi:hypothetical protein